MSQPKRYYFTSKNIDGIYIGVVMQEDDNGPFITYADYAALAAENERLRKAGDKVMDLFYHDGDEGCLYHEAYKHWAAAKEGRDAK